MGMESFGGNPPQKQEEGNEQKKSELEAQIEWNKKTIEESKAELYELQMNSPYAKTARLPVDSIKLEQGDKEEKFKEEMRQRSIEYVQTGIKLLEESTANLEKKISEMG